MAVKTRHTISGTTFDTNLAGLHKPEQVIEVLGKNVRFLAPSIVQKALMVRFLLLAFQDMVATQSERQSMSFEDLYLKCLTKLGELQGEAQTPEEIQAQQLVLGRMFSNPDANDYLLRAIRESFPDLSEPEKLTDDAFMQVATVLMQSMKLN